MQKNINFRYKINEEEWIYQKNKNLPYILTDVKWYQNVTAQALGDVVTVDKKG